MLSVNDLKPGVAIEMDGHPYEVIEVHHQKVARQSATVSVKLRNLRTEKVREVTLRGNADIKKADITREDAIFHHRTRDAFVFHTEDDETIELTEEDVEEQAPYLKPSLPVTLVYINGSPEKVELPIKAEYLVEQAPPNVRGDTSQGGTKEVTLESGARVKTPLFIEQGDTIEVNTETGEYVRRTNK